MNTGAEYLLHRYQRFSNRKSGLGHIGSLSPIKNPQLIRCLGSVICRALLSKMPTCSTFVRVLGVVRVRSAPFRYLPELGFWQFLTRGKERRLSFIPYTSDGVLNSVGGRAVVLWPESGRTGLENLNKKENRREETISYDHEEGQVSTSRLSGEERARVAADGGAGRAIAAGCGPPAMSLRKVTESG